MVSVYNSEGWKGLEEKLNKLIERKERDHSNRRRFNLRIGKLSGMEVEEGGMERESKDKVISKKEEKNGGKNFVE